MERMAVNQAVCMCDVSTFRDFTKQDDAFLPPKIDEIELNIRFSLSGLFVSHLFVSRQRFHQCADEPLWGAS